MASPRRAENQRRWMEQVQQAEKRTGSLRSYCKEQGISVSAMKYWSRKLGKAEGSRSSSPCMSRFVPLQVDPAPLEQDPKKEVLPDPRWVAEILLHLIRGAR